MCLYMVEIESVVEVEWIVKIFIDKGKLIVSESVLWI